MKNKLGGFLLVLNVIVLLIVCYTSNVLTNTVGVAIADFDTKIEVYKSIVTKQVNELKTALLKIAQTTSDVDKLQFEADKVLFEAIEYVASITHKEKVADIDKIKEANLLIVNVTRGCLGAGTHIKIENKDYVLSVAHLVDTKDDFIGAIDDHGNKYVLSVVKIDKNTDLALFRIMKACPDLPYLEVAEVDVEAGTEVILIGNPDGECDIVSEGVIAKVDADHYTITNLCYFGNSGGPLIYQGKVIGVASQLSVKAEHPPVYVNYGLCVKTSVIRNFLKGI